MKEARKKLTPEDRKAEKAEAKEHYKAHVAETKAAAEQTSLPAESSLPETEEAAYALLA